MKLKTLVESGCLTHINFMTGNATFYVENGDKYIWVTENTVLLELISKESKYRSDHWGGPVIEEINKTTIHCIMVKKHLNKLLDMGIDYLLEKGVAITQ